MTPRLSIRSANTSLGQPKFQQHSGMLDIRWPVMTLFTMNLMNVIWIFSHLEDFRPWALLTFLVHDIRIIYEKYATVQLYIDVGVLCAHAIARCALLLALRTLPLGLMIFAPDCSSWTRISRGTSCRNSLNIFGRVDLQWVQRGTMMISRHQLMFKIRSFEMICCLACDPCRTVPK